MNKSLQQYYLNVMGMPQWQLRKADVHERDDADIIYLPAGLVNDNIAEIADYPVQQQQDNEAEQITPSHNQSENTASETPELNIVEKESASLTAIAESQDVEKKVVQKEVENSQLPPEREASKHSNTAIEAQTQPLIETETVLSESASSEPTLNVPRQQVDETAVTFPDSLKAPLQSLNANIIACTKCSKRAHGEDSVRGRFILNGGQEQESNLLIITDSPTETEYHNGRLLLPDYEQLLMAIFKAVGLTRINIFISPILKCSPADNHPHTKQELKDCKSFLREEIRIIQPKIIVGLGNCVNDFIIDGMQQDTDNESQQAFNLSQARIKPHQIHLEDKVIPLYATFHPAFLYRNPLFKSKALEDWIKISMQLV